MNPQFNLDAKDTAPAEECVAVTPHDSTNFPLGACRGLYVGTLGNVALVTDNGSVVVFVGVSGILPVRCTRVNATNTTATNIVALY